MSQEKKFNFQCPPVTLNKNEDEDMDLFISGSCGRMENNLLNAGMNTVSFIYAIRPLLAPLNGYQLLVYCSPA